MVTFSILDITIIISFFAVVLGIGIFVGRKRTEGKDEYLLSGRKLGLLLFILTNVATWYGGILGVGEFTYQYGILSWFTQGLPYYLFALLFAFLFAKKIRSAELTTIPEKLEVIYGRKVKVISSIVIFILVSPAPYMLMLASLLQLIFGLNLFVSLLITAIFPVFYLFKSGYKGDIYTDAFEFFVMFAGFIIILIFAVSNYGGINFLNSSLPGTHLKITGGASPVYIIVWFLIALWTFTDPGFHQRTNAARNGSIAKWGIIISVFFWFGFDFLTTSTGLYSRAILPNLDQPVLAFPLLAERILSSGYKGIFYVALFATILSTFNSMMFLSATTFGNDIYSSLVKSTSAKNIIKFTKLGLIISSVLSMVLAYYFQSVVQIWYVVGSICIPGMILIITGSYFEKFRIKGNWAAIEIISGVVFSLGWFVVKEYLSLNEILSEIEPMLVGLMAAVIVHIIAKIKKPVKTG